VIAGLLSAGISSPMRAQSSRYQSDFDFARTKIGNFELRAETEIGWAGKEPFVAAIRCAGDNEHVQFTVDATGQLEQLRFTFLGSPEPDGDRPQIALLGDTLWLFVDGKRWEYRNIPMQLRFTNFQYSPTPEGTIILPTWRGHQAVRASASGPFRNLRLIYGDIVRAKKIEWGFKSRNWNQVDRNVAENALPPGWQSRRYSIDHDGLSQAVEWCLRAVASDEARRLPAEILAGRR
jgi:hypothetical protein